MTEQLPKTPTELEQEKERLGRFLSSVVLGTAEHSSIIDFMDLGALDSKRRDAEEEVEYQSIVQRIVERKGKDQRYSETSRILDGFLFQLTDIKQRIGIGFLPEKNSLQEPFFAQRAAYVVMFGEAVDKGLVKSPEVLGYASS